MDTKNILKEAVNTLASDWFASYKCDSIEMMIERANNKLAELVDTPASYEQVNVGYVLEYLITVEILDIIMRAVPEELTVISDENTMHI